MKLVFVQRALLSLLLLCAVGYPVAVLAQSPGGFLQGLKDAQSAATTAKIATNTDPKEALRNAINYLLGFISLLGLAGLIIAGTMYITSLGDEKKVATAKRYMLYIIVGLFVVGLSAVVVNSVITFLKGK